MQIGKSKAGCSLFATSSKMFYNHIITSTTQIYDYKDTTLGQQCHNNPIKVHMERLTKDTLGKLPRAFEEKGTYEGLRGKRGLQNIKLRE